jgi:CspA family cold shock protein
MVGDMASGRIIRFNATKGYGFIEQDSGGEDVFIHSEELRSLEGPAAPGSRVQFNILQSSRGLKACDVVVLADPTPTRQAIESCSPPRPAATSADLDLVDVMTRKAYAQEITEALIEATPDVTAAQIRQIRQHLADAAYGRGWLDD